LWTVRNRHGLPSRTKTDNREVFANRRVRLEAHHDEDCTMNPAPNVQAPSSSAPAPASVPPELEPMALDACEQARFRGRALSLAREALEQFRLELSAARFDLDITRREREGFRRLVDREA